MNQNVFNLHPLFDSVQNKTYENGLTAISLPAPGSNIIHFALWLRRGSVHEERFLGCGITHFLEHSVYLGTKKWPKRGQISNIIEGFGGSDNNAHTGHEHTGFYFSLDKNHLRSGIEILAEISQHPTFPKDRVKMEKDVILAEMDMDLDSPDDIISQDFYEKVYPFHPYRIPVIGYRDRFSTLTRDDLFEWHETMFAPNNMVLVTVGDFDPKELSKLIEQYFEPLPRGKEVPFLPNEQTTAGVLWEPVRLKVEEPRLKLAFPGVCQTSPDSIPFDLLEMILAGGNDSLLYKKYIENGALVALEASAWSPTANGLFEISAIGTEKELHRLLEHIVTDIAEVDHFLTEETLKAAKYKLLSDLHSSLGTLHGVAYSLALNETTARLPFYERDYAHKVWSLTIDDIIDVRHKYLSKRTLQSALYLPETEDKRLFTNKGSFAVSSSPVNDITTTKRDNGATLISRKGGEALTHAVIAFRGGLEVDLPGLEGSSFLLSRLLLEGSENIKRTQLHVELEKFGAMTSPWAECNAIGLTLSCFAGDEERILPLLRESLLNPSFPEERFNIVKEKVIKNIELIDESVVDKNFDQFRSLLFQNTPYAYPLFGTKESIQKITLDDIKSLYNKIICANNSVLAVTGNSDLTYYSQFLDHLAEKEKTPFLTSKVDTHSRNNSFAFDAEQTCYSIGYCLPPPSHEDHIWFELLSSWLNGLGGPLFRLREITGYAYNLNATYQPLREFGTFTFHISLAAHAEDKTKWVLKSIEEILKRVRNKKLTPSELQGAVNTLAGTRALAAQSKKEETLQIALYEIYNFGYKKALEFPEFPSDHKELAQGLQKIITKYMTPAQQIYVVTGKMDS